MKILFLLKKKMPFYVYGSKSGLLNSARMVQEYLNSTGEFETKLTICQDANAIDKEVHDFRPNICVLEAVWVAPSKLLELVKLHPRVLFIVRVHSELPFLANEGIVVGWLKQISDIKNVKIAFNAFNTYVSFFKILHHRPMYLPNIYETVEHVSILDLIFARIKDMFYKKSLPVINIGCFGAIRPLKNQLIQAVAAIDFAESTGRLLRFHINGERLEQGGDSVMKNIRALFVNSRHQLIEHPWLERKEFLELVGQMDIGMQVSFSESFNIIMADFTKQQIPSIGSEAIRWIPDIMRAQAINEIDIANKLEECLSRQHYFVKLAQLHLYRHNARAKTEWRFNRSSATCMWVQTKH